MYITLITIIVVESEKLEGAIKNGEFREADNIGYMRHRSKINKTIKHNTEN